MVKKSDSLRASIAKAKIRLGAGMGKNSGYDPDDFASLRETSSQTAKRRIAGAFDQAAKVSKKSTAPAVAARTPRSKPHPAEMPTSQTSTHGKSTKKDSKKRFQGGSYGGFGGRDITQGVGGAFKNR